MRKESNICIVYFSKTNNTKNIARILKNHLSENNNINVDEIEIIPEKMPSFMMGGYAGGRQKELPIKNQDINLDSYNFLIFGAPVWNKNPAPFIKTFLSKAKNIKGKKASFFITHGAPIGKNSQAPEVFKTNLKNHGIIVIEPWLSTKMRKKIVEDGEQHIDEFINGVKLNLKK